MASVDVTVHVTSPAATSVSVTLAPSYDAPIPVQTLLSPIAVQPANWSGALGLTGPDASLFYIAQKPTGPELHTGGSIISNPRDYNFTITATP